jgi:tetratricopeptide (TPR) repeat protein
MEPERAQRGSTQAYLSLAQIAETRQQFDVAGEWLDRIETADDELRIQVRRATLLAKQGKVSEARTLIQQARVQQPTDARAKLLAEVQLLKETHHLTDAYAAMERAVTLFPDDEEMAYEHAMLADKLGRPDEMERILRALMARKPNYHHAHNALGYALADRNTRLDEAKALILKALEMAPGDPFITDSLGWVEYRLGNLPLAAQLLRQAFEKRADVEIAVHLGEVLWAMGDREAAKSVFQQAKGMQADNAVLVETLKRLGVSL